MKKDWTHHHFAYYCDSARIQSPFPIDHYFKLMLDELNIQLPDKRQAAIEYALAIVDEILEGKKDIITGTKEIRYKAIDGLRLFSREWTYCYDSIGF